MLRSALMRDFQGADTLLIWGDNRGMQTLRTGLVSIFQDRSATFRIEGGPGVTTLALEMSRGDDLSEISGSESDLVWLCSANIVEMLVASIEPLTTASSGHQYVDVLSERASQVLISVNEYPASLRR